MSAMAQNAKWAMEYLGLSDINGPLVAVGGLIGRVLGPPLQVHPAHSPFRSFLRAVQTAGVEDPLPLCQQRLNIELPLHRDDRPSKIQCLRHK